MAFANGRDSPTGKLLQFANVSQPNATRIGFDQFAPLKLEQQGGQVFDAQPEVPPGSLSQRRRLRSNRRGTVRRLQCEFAEYARHARAGGKSVRPPWRLRHNTVLLRMWSADSDGKEFAEEFASVFPPRMSYRYTATAHQSGNKRNLGWETALILSGAKNAD
jgi:hypothetical protein